MIKYSPIFLLVSLVSAFLGFVILTGVIGSGAKVLSVLFLGLCLISFFFPKRDTDTWPTLKRERIKK